MLSGKQKEFLKKPITVLVGTKRKDGSVHINPAWFEFEDGYFYLNSAKERFWPRHIERDQQATLAFYDPESFFTNLEVVAKLVEIKKEGAAEHINKLSHRYTGKDYSLPIGKDRIILKLEPIKVYGSV